MIGISLSLCIQDLVTKYKRDVDVLVCFRKDYDNTGLKVIPMYEKRPLLMRDIEKIVAGTEAYTDEEWADLLEGYAEEPWREYPEQAKRIANLLWTRGMIEQPRTSGREPHSSGFYGNWVDRESLILTPLDHFMTEEDIQDYVSR